MKMSEPGCSISMHCNALNESKRIIIKRHIYTYSTIPLAAASDSERKKKERAFLEATRLVLTRVNKNTLKNIWQIL